MEDMRHWTPRKLPTTVPLEGRYVRIEPLSVKAHAQDLFEASYVENADDKFRWLPELPPTDLTSFSNWMATASVREDPLFYAIIDKATSKVAGRQALMRIDKANGVIEIGNIYWGPLIARKAAATEALYLFAKHVFEGLEYRRFEWKCNDENVPSKKAALRFGFQYEGTFRQHLIVKGLNRDTAWYAMIDKDWPELRRAYEAWLDPSNFDANGQQKKRLEDLR